MTMEETLNAQAEQATEKIPLPSTPRKRSKPGTNDDTTTPTKKTKATTMTPSKRSNPLGPIAPNYDEASAADKAIIRMKETEGKGWNEIQEVVERMVDAKIGGSTLKVRYKRMKANFVVFEPEHVPIFLRIKKEAEEKFELEKWQKIADGIEAACGCKYPVSALQKKFKEASKKGHGNDDTDKDVVKDEA